MKQQHPNKLECEQLRALSSIFQEAPNHQTIALGARLIHNRIRGDKDTTRDILRDSARATVRMQTFFEGGYTAKVQKVRFGGGV